MSYRRDILKEALEFFKSHPADFVAADGLRCFGRCPLQKREVFGTEITQLLQEGLLVGRNGPMAESGQSSVAVKVNPERIEDIKREAGVDWKWVIGTAVAAIALLIALLTWLMPIVPK
jgi:hypothetical protein